MSDERDLKSHQIMELTRELERVRTAQLAAIEAAEAAPESLRERVARALWDADEHAATRNAWDETSDRWRNVYRRLADAAIDVLRGPSPAHDAVRFYDLAQTAAYHERELREAQDALERVLALADEYDRTIAGRTLDGVAMRPFYHGGSVCSRIRAAIAGPQ